MIADSVPETSDDPIAGFLTARRVALIGATGGARDPGSYNARMTRALMASDFDEVVLVSRREPEVVGQPTVPTIGDYDGDPGDLCVVVVPQAVLVATLETGLSAGWSRFLIITGQVQPADRERLRLMTPVPARVWGPNCTGFLVTESNRRVMASDYTPSQNPGRPRVAVFGQSGGALGNIASMAERFGMNVSHILSTGEELDLGCEDILHHLASSRSTDVALVFIEEARRPGAFLSALDECAVADLPVVIIKVGRSARARAAAQSHSGALVGDWDEFRAAVIAHGGIVCSSFREAAGVAAVAATTIGRPRGRQAAIFTSSGGSGALVCDLAEQTGLGISSLSADSVDKLQSLALFGADDVNPFDSAQGGGTPSCLPTYLATVGSDSAVDITMIMHGGSVYDELITGELTKFSTSGKAVLAVWPGIRRHLREQLHNAGVVVLDDPADACEWVARTATLPPDEAGAEPEGAAAGGSGSADEDPSWLSYHDASALLRRAGVAMPSQWPTVFHPDGIDRVVDGASGHYPVVVKASALRGHKARVGGVTRGVSSAPELRGEIDRILRQFGSATVEEEIPPGIELLVAVIDGPFGGMIVVGLGGALADAIGRELVLSPTSTPDQVVRGIHRSRVGTTLASALGGEAASAAVATTAAVVKTLVELVRSEDLRTVEVNPLIVSSDGRAVACDVKAQRRSNPATG
jgi:acyl-CoA synthetase (NDP forming)